MQSAGNGNLLLSQTSLDRSPSPAFGGSVNQNGLPVGPYDEAKLLMHNRALLNQIQQQQQQQHLQQQQQQHFQQQQHPGFLQQQALKPPSGQAPGAFLNGQQQLLQQRLAALPNNQGSAMPSANGQVAMMQAAMMQAQQAQAHQAYLNGVNPMYMQGNPIAAAAAAAAVAATQQAQQARASQQARAAAVAMGNMMQAQAQMNQQRPGMPPSAATAQQAAAQNALLNAAMQRAAAAGQLAFQNGKPVLLQQGMQQQQQGQPTLQQLQAAAAIQQLQASNVQKQAQQIQALNQLKAAIARTQAIKAAAQNGQNVAALYKQYQLQDAMANQNGAAGRPGMPNNMQQLAANNFAAQQAITAAQQAQAAQQMARQQNAGMAGLTAQQMQSLNNAAVTQALLHARQVQQQQQQQTQPHQIQQHLQQMQQQQQMQQIQAQQQMQQMQAQHQMQQQAQQQQMRQQQMQGRPGMGVADGLLNSLKLQKPVGPNGSSSGDASPTGANAAGGVNKEQRRLALACVALQLARGGISVEQAINSGIMGGMSVTDVRFIVECYNAERIRMRDMGGAPGGNGANGLSEAALAAAALPPFEQHGQHLNRGSQAGSPPVPGSVAGSDVLLGDGNSSKRSSDSAPAAAAATAAAAELLGSLPQGLMDSNAFNAFSYGFFGDMNNLAQGAGTAADMGEELGGDGELEELDAGAAGAPAEGEELLQHLGTGEDDLEQLYSGAGGGGNGNGNGHVMPVQQQMSFSTAEAAWLTAAANANQALWDGTAVSEEEDKAGNDDLDARLANLDLGSGFF